ncbi:neurotrypsin-like [Ruditapes philippinarum]|uniref:neurotrypsin-like n=1 Tax=Ruditapes philippinarum TaxID=129788 RepID=UPI00295AA18A|nr:neurotrypsin-like [Ruditapes philippinarum]
MSSEDFDRNDLEVICRMLGYIYSSKSFYMPNGYYGQGTGQIIVSDLGCHGGESDIGLCSASWWPSTDSLLHSHDVGVSCDGHIPIRLVGNDNDPAGRVEIYHDGYYQTICGKNFDRADLMVVCRMLGIENIPRSAYWRWTTTYEEGIGTIGASHLNCDGSESSIALCGAYMPASSDCSHSHDIAVNCKGG